MISNDPNRPEESRHEGKRTAEKPEQAAEVGAGRLKEHMHSMGEDVKQRGRNVLERQKHNLAQTLHHVCEALRAASGKLKEENNEGVAEYTEALSERLDEAADYVDDVPVEDMLSNIERFARRQPHIFLGGMFLVGMAAARFLKAANPSDESDKSGDFASFGSSSGTSHSENPMRGSSPQYDRPSNPQRGVPTVVPPGTAATSSSKPSQGSMPSSSEGVAGQAGGTAARGSEHQPSGKSDAGDEPGRQSRPQSSPSGQHKQREVDQ